MYALLHNIYNVISNFPDTTNMISTLFSVYTLLNSSRTKKNGNNERSERQTQRGTGEV